MLNCLKKTPEEIKRENKMPELLERYGISVKRGFCRCFAHNDDKPSMKVYPQAVHCFSCGFHGDVFDVVALLEHTDFKGAFLALGGGYEQATQAKRQMLANSYRRERAEKETKAKAEHDLFLEVTRALETIRYADEIAEPFSDEWCVFMTYREQLEYLFELKYLEGEEVNEVELHRICQQVECGRDNIRRSLCATVCD